MAVTQSAFWKGLTTLLSIVSAITSARGGDSDPPVTKTTDNPSNALPRLAGINLSGIEFGAQTNGMYTPNNGPVFPPETQIPHFLQQNVNLFRVPVAWDSLQPQPNAKLNTTMVASYREFVEKITSKGAYVIVDVHSYGRYQGKIVGEEAPAELFVSLWTQLGEVFKDNNLVMFGPTNEPHDQDVNKLASTMQILVTALRKASINNIVLLSGTEYTSMKAFPQWYMAMKGVKNPDGSFENLLFEFHRYLDEDNSGRQAECVASHADEVKTAVELLKPDNRQAILAEIGGGNTASCEKFLPEIVGAVAAAYPTMVGFAMWSAGSFDEKYTLVATVKDDSSPTGWKDQKNWLSIKQFLPSQPVSPPAGGTPPSKPATRKTRSRCRA